LVRREGIHNTAHYLPHHEIRQLQPGGLPCLSKFTYFKKFKHFISTLSYMNLGSSAKRNQRLKIEGYHVSRSMGKVNEVTSLVPRSFLPGLKNGGQECV